MKPIKIVISEDFSDAPGARYYDDGDDSGQEFYEKLLKPKFEEALSKSTTLEVDLDGTYGYATSFISEAFGTLSTEFGKDVVLQNIKITSTEEKKILEYTIKVIKSPESKPND